MSKKSCIKYLNSQLSKTCSECNAPMKAKLNVHGETIVFVKHKKKCKWAYLNEN